MHSRKFLELGQCQKIKTGSVFSKTRSIGFKSLGPLMSFRTEELLSQRVLVLDLLKA